MCYLPASPLLPTPLLSAAHLAQLLWTDVPGGQPIAGASGSAVSPAASGQIVRIGDYVIGEEECPLLYGPPDMRY